MLNRVNTFIFILFTNYNSQWIRESPTPYKNGLKNKILACIKDFIMKIF